MKRIAHIAKVAGLAVAVILSLLFAVTTVTLAIIKYSQQNQPVSTPKSTVTTPYHEEGVTRSGLLEHTNRARAEAGLWPLAEDETLNASAQDKCEHMVDNDYWAHIAPDGTEPWYFIEKHTTYKHAGENLAHGINDSSMLVRSWLSSPGHRKNLLSEKFNRVGFGICKARPVSFILSSPVVVQHLAE